jgi:uncharacterized protein (TIGR03437 family)
MGRILSRLAGVLLFCAGAAFAQPQVGAVTNAADYTPTLAPGSIGTIFGTGLAPSEASAPSTPLPTSLNTVSVSVKGKAAPLFYVSATQINFQIPYETAAGVASLSVKTGSQQSNTVQFVVAAYSPGIFEYGAGHGVIQNQDYSVNSPTNPAASGSSIVVYLTGIGATSSTVSDGAVAPSSPLAMFTGTAKATIGETDAPVAFIGLTPESVGLAQANIQVPTLPTGDYPLFLSLNGYQSVSALVSINGSSSGFQVSSILKLVSSFSLPGVGQTQVAGISGIVGNSVAFYNNTLYLCSPSDIKVVDVTNPVAPNFLSKISDSSFQASAHNCAVNEEADKPFLLDVIRASQSLAVYDLSKSTTPAKASQRFVSIVPRSVAFSANTGFFGEDLFSYSGHDVTHTEGAMLSVDFSNLSAPVPGPIVQPNAAHPETTVNNLRPYMIVPAPNLLYAASTTALNNFDKGQAALDVFDVTNPGSIQGAGQVLVSGPKILLTLAIQGNELLAVGDTRGYSPGNVLAGGFVDFPFAGYLTLSMFDITDPGKPKLQGNVIVDSMQPGNIGGAISLGTVPLGGGFYAVTCAAPDLNATGGSGNGSLVIVDGRDPQNPEAYTYATISGLGGLTVANGYLYAAVGSGANVYKIQLP